MLRSTGLPASSRQVFSSDLRDDDYPERRSATWAREPGATAALSADIGSDLASPFMPNWVMRRSQGRAYQMCCCMVEPTAPRSNSAAQTSLFNFSKASSIDG